MRDGVTAIPALNPPLLGKLMLKQCVPTFLSLFAEGTYKLCLPDIPHLASRPQSEQECLGCYLPVLVEKKEVWFPVDGLLVEISQAFHERYYSSPGGPPFPGEAGEKILEFMYLRNKNRMPIREKVTYGRLIDKVLADIDSYKPDMIGLTALSDDYPLGLRIMDKVKKISKVDIFVNFSCICSILKKTSSNCPVIFLKSFSNLLIRKDK